MVREGEARHLDRGEAAAQAQRVEDEGVEAGAHIVQRVADDIGEFFKHVRGYIRPAPTPT